MAISFTRPLAQLQSAALVGLAVSGARRVSLEQQYWREEARERLRTGFDLTGGHLPKG
jgi:hypothetical protein